MVQKNSPRDAIVAATSGLIATTAMAPVERVKVLLQCQGEIIKSNRMTTHYKGAIDCARLIFRNEGMYYLWRGNVAGCLGSVPAYTITFAVKEMMTTIFKSKKEDSYSANFSKNLASGISSSLVAVIFSYPFDYARTRLGNDIKMVGEGAGVRQFSGMVDVWTKTFKLDGVKGLYRGFVVSSAGVIIYRGAFFGLYDSLKPIVVGDNANVSALAALGFGVTLAAGMITYPIDTVRRRMMMRSGYPVKYKGSVDCALQIIRNEGFPALMRGFGLAVLMGVAGAGTLAFFEKFKQYNKMRHT